MNDKSSNPDAIPEALIDAIAVLAGKHLWDTREAWKFDRTINWPDAGTITAEQMAEVSKLVNKHKKEDSTVLGAAFHGGLVFGHPMSALFAVSDDQIGVQFFATNMASKELPRQFRHPRFLIETSPIIVCSTTPVEGFEQLPISELPPLIVPEVGAKHFYGTMLKNDALPVEHLCTLLQTGFDHDPAKPDPVKSSLHDEALDHLLVQLAKTTVYALSGNRKVIGMNVRSSKL